jgi:hypothetical protein
MSWHPEQPSTSPLITAAFLSVLSLFIDLVYHTALACQQESAENVRYFADFFFAHRF